MLSRTIVAHCDFEALAAEAAVKVQLALLCKAAGLTSGAAVGVGTADTRAAVPRIIPRILVNWIILRGSECQKELAAELRMKEEEERS
jgi:hypothetical protein